MSDEKKPDVKAVPLNMQYGHRVIFKAMGFTSEELSLPRIAVVNSWSEQSPGHSHLRAISEGVKAGIRMAGGMPFEINVIGPCSVLHASPPDMLFDMPQREAILASIESALHVGYCHGWVGIGSCDKIVPGMLLAALRLDRPFIFIGGGQMLPCDYEGERFGFVRGQEIIGQELNRLQAGDLSIEDYERKLEEITDCCGGFREALRRDDHRQLHAASHRGPRLLDPRAPVRRWVSPLRRYGSRRRRVSASSTWP